MKYACLLVLALCGFSQLSGQSGPNSPAAGVNNAGTGTIAWTTPGSITVSDNVYASVTTSGNSNYLWGTNFGFVIPGPAIVDGIQLDIEKREGSAVAVSILNGWASGLTQTVSAGLNRCLIVVVGTENGNSVRDVTSMTYGGQAMTQVLEIMAGTTTGFSDKLEVWMLLENGISAASGTTIVPTYAAGTLLENVECYTSAVFQNVDQFNPVSNSQSTASNSSANPHQLGTPLDALLDGMSITGVICGNNTTPAATTGGTNTYTINSSFVEGTDIYVSNPSFATSGICVETATKLCTATGTEQPIFTFAGSVNRASMFGFTLQRARALDNAVYLLDAGAIVGTNQALTTTSWPITDTYVSYGGPTSLWGASWTVAQIDNAGFGAALSASRSNGNLRVDHFRITVYSTSTLPIDLLEFTASPSSNEVMTHWVTATETNNDYFQLERTTDGLVFDSIGRMDGAGNSSSANSYEFVDPNPIAGIAYYRLKQVDFNGAFSYSDIVPVTFHPQVQTAIYPNPSADGVFTFLQDEEHATNEVAVFSMDLKLVKKVMVAAGEKAIISINDQPDGIYFLIYTENGEQKVNKVQKISKIN